jgi:hypothetical protein
MRKWKRWEEETNSLEYQFANGKKKNHLCVSLMVEACVCEQNEADEVRLSLQILRDSDSRTRHRS